ncbi:hypothetical protein scyTo_0003249 [Scyliorhinus torazame]|uniref:Uncharacterized protein n=1 Tax=Scyliorhinus torazame TaxID=75743 RepID=A0A401PLZ8_SCYTO|nr:hypothetical protein [Scyliorhinus torazame]
MSIEIILEIVRVVRPPRCRGPDREAPPSAPRLRRGGAFNQRERTKGLCPFSLPGASPLLIGSHCNASTLTPVQDVMVG